jgi:membrane protease YdiL (CAAX protease family)
MMMSAVYFGLAHYYGIPSGAIGVVMGGFLCVRYERSRLGIRHAFRS